MRQRSLKELFLEAGDGPVEEGLVDASSGSSASKLRLQDLRSSKRVKKESNARKSEIKAKWWVEERGTNSGKWIRQRKEDQGRSSLLFETCVPDNLEDIADSSFFLWDVQTIWTRPRHEVVLAAVVRHKLERGGWTKHSTINYTNMMSGSYCLGQFYGMLGCLYVFTVPLSSPLYYLQVVWGWWCLPSHPTHHSAPSEKPHRMAPPMV